MNPSYIVVNLRVFRGLNLLEDSRITDPGSFRRLQNIYRKSPGVLASRPGSKLYARGDTFWIQPPVDTAPTVANTNLGTNVSDILLSAISDTLHTVENSILKGPRNFAPRALPKPITQQPASTGNNHQFPVNTAQPNVAAPTISVIPIRVSALHKMYTDFGSRSYLIGAYDFEGSQGDRLFYVDASTATAPVIKLMSGAEMSVGSGADWSFIDYYREDPDDNTKKYYVIGTNEVGKPFTISLDSSNKPVSAPLDVDADISGGNNVFGVRSMCVYNGSVVYGGFFRGPETATAADLENYSNFICFSQPGKPHKLAETDGELSDIRIGDTVYEPVTHVCVNSVSNDAQGIKGQLVVFTNKRVVTYDGLPPVSGNPTGTAFHSVALGEVGCVAPKTVVQTPAGILFLGTDALVYLIPRFSNGGPLPVSRTIEPALQHLTLAQQKQCAATYDDGHYKISVPEVNRARSFSLSIQPDRIQNLDHGNPQQNTPSIQYWLDVREPPIAQIDFGFVWSGPHLGMKYSCFAKCTGFQDNGLLYAGSAIDGTIFQTSVEGLATDPNPYDLGTAVPLVYDIQTGQFDAGDIHVDKVVKSMQFGINTSAAVSVQSSIITSGEVSGSEEGHLFTDTFSPVGYLFSSASTIANVPAIAPADSYRFISKQPTAPAVARGRTFRFRYYAAPSVSTLIKLSDLAFVFEARPERRD